MSRRHHASVDPWDALSLLHRRRFPVRGWVVAIGWILLVNIPVMSMSLRNSLWLMQDGQVGLLRDFTWWWMYLVLVPVTVFFFFWMPGGIATALIWLRDSGALTLESGSEERFARFIQRLDRVYRHWVWVILSLGFSLAYTGLILLPVYRAYHVWFTTNGFLFWFTISVLSLQNVVVGLLVIRILIAMAFFNSVFRAFTLRVVLFHPDRAGGLASLGRFGVRIGYLLGVYGLTLVVNMLGSTFYAIGSFSGLTLTTPVAIGVVLYAIIAPVVFLAPIAMARSPLRAARHRFLEDIDNQYQADLVAMLVSLSGTSAELGERLEKLDQLRKVRKVASEDFLVWPFDSRNFVRFLSATLSPIVLGLIPTALELIVSR